MKNVTSHKWFSFSSIVLSQLKTHSRNKQNPPGPAFLYRPSWQTGEVGLHWSLEWSSGPTLGITVLVLPFWKCWRLKYIKLQKEKKSQGFYKYFPSEIQWLGAGVWVSSTVCVWPGSIPSTTKPEMDIKKHNRQGGESGEVFTGSLESQSNRVPCWNPTVPNDKWWHSWTKSTGTPNDIKAHSLEVQRERTQTSPTSHSTSKNKLGHLKTSLKMSHWHILPFRVINLTQSAFI